MPKSRRHTNRHIVFDLDSTAVHSSTDMNAHAALRLHSDPQGASLRSRIHRFDLVDVMDPPGTGTITPMWTAIRPHWPELREFVFNYFTGVHVWSAGQYKYVHKIVELLFPDPEFKPMTIFTSDDCDMTSITIGKPLTRLYARYANDPDGPNEGNTFAFDDREDTFSGNVDNGIQAPPYEPTPTRAELLMDDSTLQQLICWLSLPEVLRQSDVRRLDKSRIFTTPLSTYHKMLGDVCMSVQPRSPPKRLSPPLPLRVDWGSKNTIYPLPRREAVPIWQATPVRHQTTPVRTEQRSFWSDFFPSIVSFDEL